MPRKALTLWLPLVVLLLGLGLFAYRLSDPSEAVVESHMIGKPMPDFALEPAVEAFPGLATTDLKDGKPRLLNVFASWCIPCIAEAKQLEELQRRGVDIVGVNLRDTPEDVAVFLASYGNPYSRIGADPISEVQLGIGSSGVPETFVIDGNGVITYQHIGDIRPEHIELLIEKLAEAGA
jgi:cytochrome c biogenesis protein CcmG/thiol:disulfide interchange protein DsbE